MTLVTDYLLGAVTLWLGARLLALGRRTRRTSVVWWAFAFAALTVAAFAGGTYHGFVTHLGDVAATVLWKITMLSIGLAGFGLLAAMAAATAGRVTRRWVMGLLVAKLALFAVWAASHNEFIYVIYDYTPTLIALLVVQIYAGFKHRARNAPWIIGGVLVSFAAAGIQMSGLGFHQHFNHNDIYHVVQIGGMILFYKGGTLLTDR